MHRQYGDRRIVVGPAAAFSLEDPDNTNYSIRAGGRQHYLIRRYDVAANPVNSGDQVVYLTSNSTGNDAFYDAPSGGNVITQVTIANGAVSAPFYYYDDKVGNWTITASDASPANGLTGIADATNALGVLVGAASKLLFTRNPIDGKYTALLAPQPAVMVTDAYGNMNNTVADITLAKMNGLGTLTCTANPARVVKGALTSLVTFAGCKLSNPGVYYFQASASGLTTGESGVFTLVP
ncbi:MAG: hypothetical protein NTW72_05030 [Gemmatimonadetes bacterium]|nr:hypothetical protein [Gemmatimonadota bacterium]